MSGGSELLIIDWNIEGELQQDNIQSKLLLLNVNMAFWISKT